LESLGSDSFRGLPARIRAGLDAKRR